MRYSGTAVSEFIVSGAGRARNGVGSVIWEPRRQGFATVSPIAYLPQARLTREHSGEKGKDSQDCCAADLATHCALEGLIRQDNPTSFQFFRPTTDAGESVQGSRARHSRRGQRNVLGNDNAALIRPRHITGRSGAQAFRLHPRSLSSPLVDEGLTPPSCRYTSEALAPRRAQ